MLISVSSFVFVSIVFLSNHNGTQVIVKCFKPSNMFPMFIDFLKINGMDLGSTYSSDTACRMFITAIGSCFF